jgi:hypothetical protein
MSAAAPPTGTAGHQPDRGPGGVATHGPPTVEDRTSWEDPRGAGPAGPAWRAGRRPAVA